MAPTFARFRRRLTAFLAKLYTTHQRFDPIVVGQGVFFRIDYVKSASFCLILIFNSPYSTLANDIRDFTDHFEPGIPSRYSYQASEETSISPNEHPGLLTIYHSGLDEEIKGILREPIPLADYPPPWECEMDAMHSFWTKCASVQVNIAIGLNVELTFSDPSSWPTDRTRKPPDTHSFQLYIIHLGSRWVDAGLKEQFYVWGNCDDPSAFPSFQGDWGLSSIDIGDGQHDFGPANTHAYPQFFLNSPTHVTFGIRFNPQTAFLRRTLDVSRYGKITGVWNVSPIVASSSWIQEQWPEAEPVIRDAEAYFGFIDFRYSHPFPSIEHFSHDFNHPGFIGHYWSEFHGHVTETWSHPGYLTVTLAGGNNLAGGNFAPGDPISLDHYKPPWEIEMRFIPPEDTYAWSIILGFSPRDDEGKSNAWHPGVAYFPGKGHVVGNIQLGRSGRGWENHNDRGFGPQFDGDIPSEIFDQEALYLLVRVIDSRHLQVGIKGNSEDPWFLTPVWESPFEIIKMRDHSLSYQTGKGAPANQQFLIDYLHYRKTDSASF